MTRASFLTLIPLIAIVAFPQAVTAQEQVSVPGQPGAVTQGFGYTWSKGLRQSISGEWVSPEYPVVTVVPDSSPPHLAGLRVGDVLIAVNRRDARRPPLFRDLRRGQQIVLRIRRDDEEREITYRVGG